MKYPIEITERHHNGWVRKWTLYDEAHLFEVTSHAMMRSDYTGDLDNLDEYIEWLRSDLAGLEVAA